VKTLPYRARTATGDVYEVEFPLHRETGDPVRVSQLVSAMLEAIDRELAVAVETSNGDVLQAAAMALAIRTRMIHAERQTVERLAVGLFRAALDAVAVANHRPPLSGHA
jgi:hypothetical protein